MNIIHLKERIAISPEFTVEERDLILDAINARIDGRAQLKEMLANAIDSPTVEALENVFNGPTVLGRSYGEQIVGVLLPRLAALAALAAPVQAEFIKKVVEALRQPGSHQVVADLIAALSQGSISDPGEGGS